MAAEVVIIGGGPAGMTAALHAKAAGASVLLLEHNEKLGKKLYITGKGRCNVSNLCEREEFLSQVPRNPQFLNASLSCMSPASLREWLDTLGCPTIVERGNRVFPASQKASDVTRALSRGLGSQEIRLGARVISLIISNQQVFGVQLESGEDIQAKAVILATGGISYPITGSTGMGQKMAEAAGHKIRPLSPSLSGFDTQDDWPRKLQGLTLKNIALHAAWPGKGHYDGQGELLFTHFGISGPLVLTLSSYLAGRDVQEADVSLDLKPALDISILRNRLSEDISRHGRKALSGLMVEYMPASMSAVFPQVVGLDGAKALNQLTVQERESLLAGLKHLPIRLKSHRPFTEAVITCGGVDVKQVNPSTLESKLIKGLYFAGEVMDVDALTGGFNLQIAFSTGALAGQSAGQSIHQQ